MAGGLGAAHQALGQIPVGRAVQLVKPRGVTEFGGDIFHRVFDQGRYAHRNPGARGRPRGREITMTVLRAQCDDPDRRHENGSGPTLSPELDGQIALGGTHQHAWDQPPMGECGRIHVLGSLVAGPTGHV